MCDKILTIDIEFSAEPWHEIADLPELIERAGRKAFAHSGHERGKNKLFEVAINLSDDATVRDLNGRYRGKDKATNVLSFPLDEEMPADYPGPQPLGDLILAFETVQREASEQGKLAGHHIAHLVVHGILHLCGHDHQSDDEAAQMEKLETDILAQLQIPCPYRGA